MLIEAGRSLLFIVDIQERLAPAIAGGASAIGNNQRLLVAANQLAIPVFVSEQYVRGLGPTVAALADLTVDAYKFEKIHFSATREAGILAALGACARPQVILSGMETHVCVLQTALGLLSAGWSVYLVADACGSRTPENKAAAIDRLRAAGVTIVTTEMVIFEWLAQAGTADFRALLPQIK